MYKILVADDEDFIRQGIKYLCDYESLGFSIADEAANGTQAYEKILDIQPDVVFMDIRMPGMSGLEVIEKLTSQDYQGKIVIISSYTDFRKKNFYVVYKGKLIATVNKLYLHFLQLNLFFQCFL